MEANETLFVVKREDEYCFLWPEERPKDLYGALLGCAGRPGYALTREDALEVIEEIVLERLRAI